jgi:hypothetical protein
MNGFVNRQFLISAGRNDSRAKPEGLLLLKSSLIKLFDMIQEPDDAANTLVEVRPLGIIEE